MSILQVWNSYDLGTTITEYVWALEISQPKKRFTDSKSNFPPQSPKISLI